MQTLRGIAAVVSMAVLLAGCDPRTELEQDAPNISTASLRAEGKGVVVAELFFDNIHCARGDIILGSADGTQIHDNVTRRTVHADANRQFAGSVVAAGKHYILRLDCGGQYQFAIYRQKPVWFASAIYYPLGSFTVEPGEVVYIGSLHAAPGKKKWFTAFQPAAIGIEDRSEAVREMLRNVSPALAEAMLVRLAAPTGGTAGAAPRPELPPPASLVPPSTDASAVGEQADAGAATKPDTTGPSRADDPCSSFVSGQNRSPIERAACEQSTANDLAVAKAKNEEELCSGVPGASSIGRIRPWNKIPCDAY